MIQKIDNSIGLYKKSLDATWLRNSAIANNIANVDTPNYKRQDVKFESVLKDYYSGSNLTMNKTNDKHFGFNGLDSLEPSIEVKNDTSYRMDDNNINMDVESAELAKNAIKFNFLADQLTGHLRRLKIAISNGRG